MQVLLKFTEIIISQKAGKNKLAHLDNLCLLQAKRRMMGAKALGFKNPKA